MPSHQSLNDSFNALYGKESDAIFRFCLFRVSDREQALDMTQETFSRVWQSMCEGKEMLNVRAFTFTIARHLIIDWYRKKKPSSLEGLTDDEAWLEDSFLEDPASLNLEMQAEGRFLIDHIEKLGPSYKQAVYLRFVEGLSPPQVAEILGISANAVSVRINRGIAELRKLTGYDHGGKDMGENDDA